MPAQSKRKSTNSGVGKILVKSTKATKAKLPSPIPFNDR